MSLDKYHTREEIEDLIDELQDLIADIIVYEYDYMTDDAKDAIIRIAELLNLNIE
jgi:hypothetical protein